jgi:hypothetical protein
MQSSGCLPADDISKGVVTSTVNTHVGDVEQVGVEMIHIHKAPEAKDKRDDLPDVERREE